MRLILKSLWAHRKQNGWIFAEIAIITLLSWFMVDYLAVSAYSTYFCIPAGDFEKDHLCVGQMVQLRGEFDRKMEMEEISYDEMLYDEMINNQQVLKKKLENLPEVQSVCITDEYVGDDHISNGWRTFALVDDTLKMIRTASKRYFQNEQFFETHGLQPIEGSPAAEVLSREVPQDGVIITRSVAKKLFGTDQVVGKRLARINNIYLKRLQGEVEGYLTIAGVVEDVRNTPTERYPYMAFLPDGNVSVNSRHQLLLRLKPDVDAEVFVAKHLPTLTKDFRAGIFTLATLETYNQHFERQMKRTDETLTSQLASVPLVLFAIIVVLGTLGTYWLQIRKRKEDIGIMRAFGASKMRIFWTFLAEGAILTLLATLLGDFVWLQFIASWLWLSDGNVRGTSGLETDWVTQFWPHFLIISLIVYLLLLVIVSLGIALPAWNICRKKIVEALRDE